MMKKQIILLTLLLATQSAWASWVSPPSHHTCYIKAQELSLHQNPSRRFEQLKIEEFPCTSSISANQIIDKQGNHRSDRWVTYRFQRLGQAVTLTLGATEIRTPDGKLSKEAHFDGEPYTEFRDEESGLRSDCYRSSKLTFCVKD